MGCSDTSSFLLNRKHVASAGLAEYWGESAAPSTPGFSEAPQSSSPLEGLVGNSVAVFCLSITGQLDKHTPPEVFPHLRLSQNRLLLIHNHRFSCSVSVILNDRWILTEEHLETVFNISSLVFFLSRFSYNTALFLWLLLPLFHTPDSILGMNHSCY